MKVSLNELIANRMSGSDFSWDSSTKTFTSVFEGFYYQTETCDVFTSEDITDESLLNEIDEVDNFEDFKEEIHNYLEFCVCPRDPPKK